MSLSTRCPVCATAFRVQRAQLAARSGQVRCGKCSTVFDGIAALVEERAEPLTLEPSPQMGLFDPSRRPQGRAAATAAIHAGAHDEPLPEFLAQPESRPRATITWALLALLASALLLGQVTYRYRTEIAVLVPDARAPLEAACRVLRCEVPLPRRPELMSIESSDLQADPRRENVIVLNALIRNRAPFAQDYPSLELTLTDESDRPVLRRVLAAPEYLGRGSPQGLAAGAEAPVRLNLDAGQARATGYRLYLFYPQ
jgi:predicted Zn finger-like uncharacterized protein